MLDPDGPVNDCRSSVGPTECGEVLLRTARSGRGESNSAAERDRDVEPCVVSFTDVSMTIGGRMMGRGDIDP